jgi:Domain of unknown function (DUF397)
MTPQGIDLSRAVWRKSSWSASNGGQCVEVAQNLPAAIAVRDSRDPDGAHLMFTPAAWAAFLYALKREGRPGQLPPPQA